MSIHTILDGGDLEIMSCYGLVALSLCVCVCIDTAQVNSTELLLTIFVRAHSRPSLASSLYIHACVCAHIDPIARHFFAATFFQIKIKGLLANLRWVF